jgi:RNA polymerase sigma-70 factor (ECF subfamily)
LDVVKPGLILCLRGVMDDKELAAQAGRGDDAAFELLVRRNFPALWKLARAIVHDDPAAEEAVQNCLLSAHRALGSFRGDAAVRTWLLAICYRCSLNQLRAGRRSLVSIDSLTSFASRHDDTELRMDLRRAVDALGESERTAFTLVEVLGYTREEAAVIVGIPSSTLRSQVARARAHLAESLAGIQRDIAEGVGA